MSADKLAYNWSHLVMSLRVKMLSILDVVLRVPPLFIMDSILIHCLSSIQPIFHNNNHNNNHMITTINTINDNKLNSNIIADNILKLNSNIMNTNASDWNRLMTSINASKLDATDDEEDVLAISLSTSSIVWVTLYLQAFVMAFSLFLLSTRHLLSIYVWLASIGVILWSYISNEEYNKYVFSIRHSTLAFEIISFNFSAIFRFVANYLFQVFLAICFCFASKTSQNVLPKRLVGITFIAPNIISLIPAIPSVILAVAPVISAAIALLYIILNLVTNIRQIFITIYSEIQWSRTIVRNYGLYTLLESQWIRLHVPQVLRVFWLTRLTEQAVFLIADSTHKEYMSTGIIGLTFESRIFWSNVKQLMVRGCETIVAVLGMTSVLSGVSHQIGCLMQSFLLVEDPEDRSIGTVSAILFFILALQTGLTGLEPEKRFLRLYRNLCLLFTAILHFIHNMVSPLLFSLSASRNMSINRHGRALIVCAFLIAFPMYFLIYLWTHHAVSTWLLAVSAFSIEVVIKVIISLLIYGLFMIDAFRTSMWEQLDDYVYYIRSTGNSIEFIFGIFLFFNGAWILLFESGGTIRALMMCIHAYFNIWLQAKAGWKTFMKRRHAVYKINSLPEASEEQLRNFDDVCAICYQELTTARITKCNHYFHGVCLRKWLYVQDMCPLCHETLYNINDTNDPNDSTNDNIMNNMDGVGGQAGQAGHDHND
ncbi:unnamed protein product [Medioppia subpectinata]|uniref:RING-type domain-containing protein n=1 Tax=Medioppia subpectinata TaxID=1979941 RepID=A0A7R9PTK9_9ACAR|nr:unnamed protein product [Medioppia subpectinata]CAG2100551.1 unnamed protein product [Medioppia subpectinata]